MPIFAASEAPPRPESMKFPVFSLLAGNLDEFAADSPLHQRVYCEPDFRGRIRNARALRRRLFGDSAKVDCARCSHTAPLSAGFRSGNNGTNTIRPVFHQLEARIEAHIFIDFSAY